MELTRLYEIVEGFTQNDWRQVSMQFDAPKNPKYTTVISAIKKIYPNYSKTEAAHLVRSKLAEPPICECGSRIAFRNDPKPYYPVYCSLKCKNTFSNTQAESLYIDGVFYRSFTEAISATGVGRDDIRHRLFSQEYPTYIWNTTDHDSKCIEKLKAHHKKLANKDLLLSWKESGVSQGTFCDTHGFEPYQLRYALAYFGIDSAFDQVNQIAREFLNDKDRFIAEYQNHSMERLSLLYNVSPGTIKNYAVKYGCDTSLWARNVSGGETEMYNFIKSICADAIQSFREVFGKNGKELDVFVPSKNIGFEFNGVFTHSDKNKDKSYHRSKHLQYREAGYRYVQIWEDDWNYRNDKTKAFISNILGDVPRTIGARETIVQEISLDQFKSFMDKHHMQGGGVKACHRLALIHNGIIVAAMGFRNIAENINVRYSDGEGIELVRFANTSVAGAFTKLIAHFEKHYEYDYITSFADLEIVSPFSNVYSKNGFTFVKEIKEDYRYFNAKTKVREHKSKWRKETFKKIGFDISNRTEFEMADNLGLLRCWDSGKILYLKLLDASKRIRKETKQKIIELDFD